MRHPFIVVTYPAPHGAPVVTECHSLRVVDLYTHRAADMACARPAVVWARGREQQFEQSVRVTL